MFYDVFNWNLLLVFDFGFSLFIVCELKWVKCGEMYQNELFVVVSDVYGYVFEWYYFILLVLL